MTRAEERAEAVVWRARLVAACLGLTALMFHQAPGLVVPDTKLDLTANPGGFLLRALHMWDPQGAFGQLQNQAYGYLFPVGPFHWALTTVGLPPWVVQRLWWSVVVCVAFVGLWRLAGALGIGSRWTRLGAALFFALTPRMLGEVAVTSVEVWPLAMSPWVLLPLVDPRPRSWVWRISRSALAFAFVGGVNAVATGATLILPTLWFATRSWNRRTMAAAAAWLAAVVAVSVWWLGPLVLLGRHSPPFLDWIENAPVTTAFASPWEALRGTTPWLGYLTGGTGPSWPGAWPFVTNGPLVVASAMVAVGGLAGLLVRRCPERRFLVLAMVVGLVLVTLGHTGSGQSPAAPELQRLLDGALAPLRNTHKFELVVRVPLALGLAEAVAAAGVRARARAVPDWLLPVLVCSLLFTMLAPAMASNLARPEGYRAIPAYWHDTARWLDAQTGPGTALVVPAASFADFTWGSTKDEPLQALMKRPFAVRDAVPLGSAGATRLLDEIESTLESGHGGPELRAALRMAGVRYLVVRNDLRPDVTRNVQALLHEALTESGLTAARSFGPRVNQHAEEPGATADSHTRLPYPSVEVFDTGVPSEAEQLSGASFLHVTGGPEDVPAVLSAVADPAVSVTGSDSVGAAARLPGTRTVLTDGNRHREVFFGRASDNASETLSADDAGRTGREVNSYVSDPAAPMTVRSWDGDLLEVSASSSASDANATLRLGPGTSPAAAIDGDPRTAWVSGRFGKAVGEWLEVSTRSPRDMSGTTVQFSTRDPLGAGPVEVSVETDRGTTTSVVAADSAPQPLAVPHGTTSRLRLTITQVAADSPENGVGISELRIPGLVASSSMAVPAAVGAAVGAAPDAIVLRSGARGTSECVQVGTRPLCDPVLGRDDEEATGIRRTIQLPAPATYAWSGTVAPATGPEVDGLVDGLQSVRATASSRAVQAVAGRPGAAVDGDLGTGWVASRDDPNPRLTVVMPRVVSSGQIQFQVDQYLAASRPTQVQVTLDGGKPFTADVTSEGRVSWSRRPFRTISLLFLKDSRARTVDSSGFSQFLPVGVSELVVQGAEHLATAADPRAVTGAACGFGPTLSVDGRGSPTKVVGTIGDVLAGRPLRWAPCAEGGLALPSGNVVLSAARSGEFLPTRLVLSSASAAPGAHEAAAAAVQWRSPVAFSVPVATMRSGSVLAVPQNFNAGWVGQDAAGRRFAPVRVNGWQQGWVVPAGASGVLIATFAPDRTYRGSLALGALLVLVAAGVVLASRRQEGAPALEPASASIVRLVAAPLLLVVGFGWVGLVGAVLGLAVAVRTTQRPLARLGVVLLGTAVAAGLAARSTWPLGNAGVENVWVQLGTLAAIGAVAGSAAWAPVGSPRRPRRNKGRSIP